jgi:hypothetical protein
MPTGECITKGGGGTYKSYEIFAFMRHPALLLALPLLMEFNDLMPLPLTFGFQVTYEVNNKERFEQKKRCNQDDRYASIQPETDPDRYPGLTFPVLLMVTCHVVGEPKEAFGLK